MADLRVDTTRSLPARRTYIFRARARDRPPRLPVTRPSQPTRGPELDRIQPRSPAVQAHRPCWSGRENKEYLGGHTAGALFCVQVYALASLHRTMGSTDMCGVCHSGDDSGSGAVLPGRSCELFNGALSHCTVRPLRPAAAGRCESLPGRVTRRNYFRLAGSEAALKVRSGKLSPRTRNEPHSTRPQ